MRRNRWFEAVDGPTRFFFFNLFESDPTGAPLAIRSRTRGSIDSYAAVVGRWLVTRDGFDFLVFYLPDFDYASHAFGPESGARGARARRRRAGGIDPRGRAASSSSSSATRSSSAPITDRRRWSEASVGQLTGADENGVVVAASNRAGMIYRLPGLPSARANWPSGWTTTQAQTSCFPGGRCRGRAAGGRELRFAPENGGWRREGDGTC